MSACDPLIQAERRCQSTLSQSKQVGCSLAAGRGCPVARCRKYPQLPRAPSSQGSRFTALAVRNDWCKIPRVRKLRDFFSTLAAIAILATVIARIPLNAQGQNPPKNVKVLTPENYMALMQTFPVALGVESQGGCNFCHEADRSLDTKPTKVKARQMIEMVAEINAKFGDGKIHVTCWTCHLGSTKPEIARIPK